MAQEEQGNQEGMVNPIEVQNYLKGVDYPADKQTIIETAQQQGADESVMDMLNQLPDREFDGPTAISQEISDLR